MQYTIQQKSTGLYWNGKEFKKTPKYFKEHQYATQYTKAWKKLDPFTNDDNLLTVTNFI
jgi:hypothetical protein